MNNVYAIYVDDKKDLINKILEKMDDLIYANQLTDPVFELHLSNIQLQENEMYELLHELIISKHKLIKDIIFETEEIIDKPFNDINDDSLVIYGNIDKNTTLLINTNLYVYGTIMGNIVLKKNNLSVYASEFVNANIITKDKSLFIENKKDHCFKI